MKIKSLMIASCVLFLTACGVNIPRYEGSFDNVSKLENVKSDGVKAGNFKAAKTGINKISVRNNPMKSPHGEDLLEYIKYALTFELEKAGLMKENATRMIDALLLENSIDTGLGSTASGKISAEFRVMESDKELYRQTYTITKEWESSFVGAIAIPNAANNYPLMVEELLNQLYSDANFIKALEN